MAPGLSQNRRSASAEGIVAAIRKPTDQVGQKQYNPCGHRGFPLVKSHDVPSASPLILLIVRGLKALLAAESEV
jgi:hypothetical protein